MARPPWEPTPGSVPVFPLKGTVVLPGTPHVFEVARERSIHALESAKRSGSSVLCLAQRNDAYNPAVSDLYPIGTIATVETAVMYPSVGLKVTVMGTARAFMKRMVNGPDFPFAEYQEAPAPPRVPPSATKPAMVAARSAFDAWAAPQKQIPTPFGTILAPAAAISRAKAVTDPDLLADFIGAHVPMPLASKVKLLELTDPVARLEFLAERLRESARA